MKVDELCDDLLAERADLIAVLEPLDADGWATPTPAPGWSVLDQVTHLAYFDDRTREGMADPEAFRSGREAFIADVDGAVDRVRAELAAMPGDEVLAWLRRSGPALADEARRHDAGERVPWYGPDMGLPTAITARIMETWAHGQDVADALGVGRPPSARLGHVAFLSYRAIPNSFLAHGRPVPDVPVRVELDGVLFGPEDATDVVRGPLLDFCLVATQRRHPADTALVAEGPVAAEWLTIAQVFAGPPGAGRQPGQFS